MRDDRLEQDVRALDEGHAFVAGEHLWTVTVTGADAVRWLNDLVTASVEDLPVGASIRSLLLTPTGRIRADLHVLRVADGFLLAQPDDQPARVAELLGPYVLSSEVALTETAARLALLSAPNGWRVAADPPPEAVEVGPEAAESWRVRRGIARFPVDLDEGSIPAEADLDDGVVIDRSKGCFLGQESVAKVRNLGHPPRVVVPLTAGEPVQAGEPVSARGQQVGFVTSAVPTEAGSALLARVRWESRSGPLQASSGAPLRAP